MKEELRLLNALIGMAHGSARWPTPLRDLGYRLTSLQRDVGLTIDGEQQLVTPEAVFQSIDDDGCLIVESKSASFSAPQARKYWQLTATDLVTWGACVEPTELGSHSVAPAYFCSRMHTEQLAPQVEEFNRTEPADLPLVDYDNHRFELRLGSVRLSRIHSLFDAGLHYEERDWPTRFVPFDDESPPGEIAPPVIAEVVALLLHPDVSEFTAEDVARGHPDSGGDGCVHFFGKMSTSKQHRYKIRIAEIIEQLRQHYLSDTIDRIGSGPRWRQVRPVSDGRQMKALTVRTNDFCRRLQEDEPLPRQRQHGVLITEEQLEALVAEDDHGEAADSP